MFELDIEMLKEQHLNIQFKHKGTPLSLVYTPAAPPGDLGLL